jgi:hypothetical protein
MKEVIITALGFVKVFPCIYLVYLVLHALAPVLSCWRPTLASPRKKTYQQSLSFSSWYVLDGVCMGRSGKR